MSVGATQPATPAAAARGVDRGRPVRVRNRTQLVAALHEAAEVEHALACMYLFAGFSLRPPTDPALTAAQGELVRSWHMTLNLLARQEMEHLGIVCNLLAAVGGAPDLTRRQFPQRPRALPDGLPLTLRPLDADSLDAFICFERPAGQREAGCPDEDRPVDPDAPGFASLQGLYDEIAVALRHLDGQLPEPLFLGPPAAQTDNSDLTLSKGSYAFNLVTVTDQASAQAAIAAIIEEGEGAPHDRQDSHYGRLVAMRQQLRAECARDPDFRPAFDVARNPVTGRHGGAAVGSRLTHPLALALAEASNDAYQIMLQMMSRFFAREAEADPFSPATEADDHALVHTAFFPLMTMVIRPLGETLCQIPAHASGGSDDGPRAGMPFETGLSPLYLPGPAAWPVLSERLGQLAANLAGLARRAREEQPHVAERLAFVAGNVGRLARDFRAAVGGT